jgi:hypothetical protein
MELRLADTDLQVLFRCCFLAYICYLNWEKIFIILQLVTFTDFHFIVVAFEIGGKMKLSVQ